MSFEKELIDLGINKDEKTSSSIFSGIKKKYAQSTRKTE